MNIRSLIFILLCFAGHLCYGLSNNAVERVIGGSDTDIKEVPYMLSIKQNGEFLCGAAIINEKYAVTSAACLPHVFKHHLEEFTVCSGSSIYTNCTVHKIVDFTIHEKYKDTPDYDIAVFEVEPEFSYNDNTKAVNLASNKQSRKWGKICGWGLYRESNGEIQEDLSKNLKCIKQQLVDDCKKIYGNKITPRMICYMYREGGKGACHGDTGGPITSDDNILLGISLLNVDCAERSRPDVYTDTIYLKDWIKKNTRINT